MIPRRLFAASALLLVAMACGSESPTGQGAGAGHHHDDQGTIPGEAASASDADREIEVVARDDLSFDPESIEVESGEVVTFVIVNEGQNDHEFVLGDAAYQEGHAHAMSEGSMAHGENAVSVAPGETEELTWRFSSAGEVLFGCHEPGHYQGGMVGTIAVD